MDPTHQPASRQHQRFSWQAPPADISVEEQVPSYPQLQQRQYQQYQQPQQPQYQQYQLPLQRQYQQYQQYQQQVPQQQQQQHYHQPQYQQYQQPSVHTDHNASSHNRGFSYAQTPIEHRGYAPSPIEPSLPHSPHRPIDPHTQSTFSPHSLPAQSQPPPSYLSASYPHDKASSPISPLDGSHPPPISPVSPLVEPPQIYTQEPNKHTRQRSNLSPINTNVGHISPMPPTTHTYPTETYALPSKTHQTPISPGPMKDPADHQLPLSPNSQKSYAAEPYSPHGFTSNTRHAVFSPDSAHGPNGLDFALHQPGQVAHPNMDLSSKGTTHEWKHSLCECGDMSTCLTGLFCPCILYGRTSYRLSQRSAKKDPTEMLSYKPTNGHCMLMGLACGLWGLFPAFQRMRLRHAYKLTGSLGSDLLKGCCCCCCVTIQNEREMKDREESQRKFAGPAGPASAEVYTSSQPMAYTPQR